MRIAPSLDTERLTLRAHAPADFDELRALWADPDVVRYTVGRPQTSEEVWARLLRAAGLWPLVGYGYWVVRERDTNRLVGEVGIADFRRDLAPPVDLAPEAGWILSPAVHGNGYATEAMRAVLAWADAHLAAPRTTCIIVPENGASLRVAAKLGFVETVRATHRDEPVIVLERSAR